MGVKDGFMGANVLTKIAFFVVLLAVVVNWIAFCTTSWYVFSGTSYIGLWRQCGAATCGTMLDGSPDDEFDAIQAFAIFGFIALNVGFLLIVLYMFWGSCKGNAETGIASAITLFVSAGCWLISVAIFGAEYEDFTGRFGYSYALAVCALILALIGGIIMIIGGRGNSSVSSK
ncbi:epithelial membrane protein 1-like [Biomphalaria glabrata]|uniref:Epithelial membrane protein 1-like n=1 Tax=Biomphalaria glabrata TaxID=6526 RepID=A0A2C9L472_BIOGL|nr:epithelial membrane protein 1-like [Biomphalaria glabrata]